MRNCPVPTHGSRESVCTCCGLIFSSVSAFDRHWVGLDTCTHPTKRGMVVVRRRKDGLPVWGKAGNGYWETRA